MIEIIAESLTDSPEGPRLDDAGLAKVARAIARQKTPEEMMQAADACFSVMQALTERDPPAPAATTLLGLAVAISRKLNELDKAAAAKLEKRAEEFQKMTGSQSTGVLGGGERPEGTIPAGPMARFKSGK